MIFVCFNSQLDKSPLYDIIRQENKNVLFAIDNIAKVDHSQKNWDLGGKATALL